MKVIFTDNVKGVAGKGDVKNVKNGFFRNYLQPNRKAVPATEQLIKQWENLRKKMLIEKEQLRAQFEEIKRRLEGAKLKLEKKVTKKGTLYGGIKPSDVAKAIKTQMNLEIPETAIILKDTIKTVGTFEITLNFGEGIEGKVSLEVVEKT